MAHNNFMKNCIGQKLLIPKQMYGIFECINGNKIFSLRTFAPIATAHFFAHVTHTSCIADHEGKHDAKGANIFQKNGT